MLGSLRFQPLKVLYRPVYEDTVLYGGYDATGLVEREDGNFKGAVNQTVHEFSPLGGYHEHPLVDPQVSHLRQVPLRTRVKLPHSAQLSPS